MTRIAEAGVRAILPVGASDLRAKTRAKLVEAEPEGISGPGFESPHLHQLGIGGADVFTC